MVYAATVCHRHLGRLLMYAENFWARFVTEYREDQDALNAEARREDLRVSITNYSGNAAAPLTYPGGPASQYTRQEPLA